MSPRFVSAAGPAFGVATVLLIIYFAATKWLVSLGHAVSPTLLLGQLAVYPALVVGSLTLIRWLGCKWPFAGRSRLQWVSVISVGAAIVLLVIRFFWKHPVSEWGGISPQGWRDIVEGYLIGRLIVPLAEELVFRGVLFCLFEPVSRSRAVVVVIGTAVAFAALHWPPLYGLSPSGGAGEVLSALAAGLAFGALRAWTNSILPGLGLHMIGNTIGF